MNSVDIIHTSQSVTSALAFALGFVGGQPNWPSPQAANYIIAQTDSTYSKLSVQAKIDARQPAYSNFLREVSSIYASLCERQTRLDDETAAAIFDDIDSLYES